MAREQWLLYTKRAPFEEIAARFLLSPVSVRIMINRGIKEEEIEKFLYGRLDALYSPYLFKGMKKAIDLLKEDIICKRKIRVVGDYDIDGVCSTYILVRALQMLGAKIDYEIPHRIHDGYGINTLIIEQAKREGVDTILTCDNGIAAFEALELGKELGLRIIVTDHHEVFHTDEGADRLPCADVIVNPKQADCSYPYKSICGALVAYKLVEALFAIWKEEGRNTSFDIDMFLEMVAIATVGDVMPLLDENRLVVKYGLEKLNETKNIGLSSLIEVCGLADKEIGSYHIGFVIGPCLNAGGRLLSAKIALKMLLSESRKEAMEHALHLKELNDERKELTATFVTQAKEQIDKNYSHDRVLVAYLPDCHESIAGIIAGRIREAYCKPSIVLTNAGEEGMAKGSARSIEGYHMFQELCKVSDILPKFGGHPMAAGMSIKRVDIDIFRKRLNAYTTLCEADFIEKIWIDVALPFSYITKDFIKELEKLEPFGMGNDKPKFAQKDVEIIHTRLLGANRNVVKLELRGSDGVLIDALIFTDGDIYMGKAQGKKRIDIIYYPTINTYMGKESIQIIIKNWKFKNDEK